MKTIKSLDMSNKEEREKFKELTKLRVFDASILLSLDELNQLLQLADDRDAFQY